MILAGSISAVKEMAPQWHWPVMFIIRSLQGQRMNYSATVFTMFLIAAQAINTPARGENKG
jgi:hypothetical protein